MVQSIKAVMQPSSEHASCKKCGLFQNCKTPFMESDGAERPEILVIGEAPGETEDYKGVPFVGRAGQLLRQALEEFTDISTIRFTNIVRCRPPENKIAKRYIDYCKQFALAEIEHYDPAVVILLGNSPLNAVLGQSGISSWNGVIVNKNDRVYLPLYHPAYILRNMSMMDEWLQGINKLYEDINKKPRFERVFPKTILDIQMMQKYLEGCEYISFDVETNALDAYASNAKLLSISFAGGEYSYAFPIDHRESWWDTSIPKGFKKKVTDREYVIGMVCEILESHTGKLIGHNTKFDQMHIRARYGLDTEAGGDTMLISHLLDSRQGIHGLKRLAGIYLGMYEYEHELTLYKKAHKEADPDRGGSYDAIPLDILLPYGAMDAEATYMLHEKLFQELSTKQKILYDQMILPASDVLGRMQSNGIMIDSYVAKRYSIIYRLKRDEVFQKILADKKVKKLMADKQRELDIAYDLKGEKVTKRVRKAKQIFVFNPGSFLQLQELYYRRYKMPVIAYTDTGAPTTKSSTLKVLEDKYPILYLIRYYKLLSKMLSTYIDPAANGKWLSGDGRVRTTYNLHGSRTGRLSSSGNKDKGEKISKNLQNIPTPEKEPNTLLQILPIKNLFTHSYVREGMVCKSPEDFQTMFHDGVIMSCDYSGMELRCFASLSNCKPMMEIHKSGRDFHSTVAVIASKGKHIKDVPDAAIATIDKAVRYRYKWTNWTLLYGGGASTLVHMYGMTETEAEAVIEEYYSAFPEVLDYRKKCIEFAEENGYIESPYGRREKLFYIHDGNTSKRNADRRAAVNMPVQSGASDTLLIAAIIIDDKLFQDGYETKLINTVHDSLMLDCPRNEVKQVSVICKDVMENVTSYARKYMPDLDMSWLICPLKADIEVGTHYGSLVDLEDWEE